MKNIKNVLAVIIIVTAGLFSNAQMAHINSDELVAAMPATKAMGDNLKLISQNYDTEYKAQALALQAKYKKYGEEAGTKTDAENQTRQAELTEEGKKLQLYAGEARQDLQEKELEFLKPIIERAQKAIQDVAKEKGIKYVLDSASGKGLIVFEGEDLLPAVKAKLGI
ncbi:MAG: OmpH family outer membrane protein [Flavobacteriaceae bacterium]